MRHRSRRDVVIAALVASLFALSVSAYAQAKRAPAPGDPLASADCRQALNALNALEVELSATARPSGATAPSSAAASSASMTANGRRAGDAPLAAARRDAAIACLATHADPATPPQRLVRPPPIDVAPLAIAPASAPPAVSGRTAPLAPAARPAERPYAITSCDAGGCWANDGSRLNRVGPNLVGPRGVCTMQGTLVQCP